MIVICLLYIILWGCENQSRKPNHPIISESIVAISNVQNSDEEVMHFNVSVKDYGLGPEQEFSIRIRIQDSNISDLIKTETMESADTWQTLSENSEGVFEVFFIDFREIKGTYSIEEVQNLVENEQAIIVELYNSNGVITQSVMTTFEDRRDH